MPLCRYARYRHAQGNSSFLRPRDSWVCSQELNYQSLGLHSELAANAILICCFGVRKHISTGDKTSDAVCQDQTQMGYCPSSDFKFYSIRNIRNKRTNYKGYYYYYEDGISFDSVIFLNTATLQCVTSDDCSDDTLQWN